MKIDHEHLFTMLSALAMVSPPDPKRKRLFDLGWLPLGAEAGTGIEGWGKVIDGRAVTCDMASALEIEAGRHGH